MTSARTAVTCTVFVRALGLVYAVAIVSLWVQVDGLIGRDGILPVGTYLARVGAYLGDGAWLRVPTVLWIDASNAALHGLCALGLALALGVMAGVAPLVTLGGLWVVYLSLTTAGQVFLGFQWDNLLLETGFLAIFLVVPCRRLGRGAVRVSPLVVLLLRWLLFRLMLGSGLVKVASGDPAWWPDLTALAYHYETTCLPVWIGWYAHQAPLWVHRASCALVLASELIVPFLIFGPRRARRVAFWSFVLQQIAIAATGNYGFFNLLSVVLCLMLLEDDSWPRRWRRPVPPPPGRGVRVWQWGVVAPIGVAIAVLGAVSLSGQMDRFLQRFGGGFALAWPPPVERLVSTVAPFRSVNGYGLFARMTKRRPEIVIEGTRDGRTWLAYEFRWKPGALDRRPRFVAPHQPRLDWQMWFAALGSVHSTPWFVPFLRRLLTGSPAVLALLATNPFPEAPPRAVRAVLYDYRFTTAGPAWWRREPRGSYVPPLAGAAARPRPVRPGQA